MEPSFLQKLVAKFDLGDLSVEEQERILDEMSMIVMEGALTRAIPILPVESAIQYDQMMARDADISELFGFLSSSVPGFDEIVQDEVATLESMLAKAA